MGYGRDYCDGGPTHWRSRVRMCDLCHKCPRCEAWEKTKSLAAPSVKAFYELADGRVCLYRYACSACQKDGSLRARAAAYGHTLCDSGGRVIK